VPRFFVGVEDDPEDVDVPVGLLAPGEVDDPPDPVPADLVPVGVFVAGEDFVDPVVLLAAVEDIRDVPEIYSVRYFHISH
jgi:hypothetical protein